MPNSAQTTISVNNESKIKKCIKTPYKHWYLLITERYFTIQYLHLCSAILVILNLTTLLTLLLLHMFTCKLTLCKRSCLFICLDIDGNLAVLPPICCLYCCELTAHDTYACLAAVLQKGQCKLPNINQRGPIKEVNILSG